MTADSFSPIEMDAIAHGYARNANLKFDFRATKTTVFIPKRSNCLAYIWYTHAKGMPALLCRLNFAGKVEQANLGPTRRTSSELPYLILGADDPTVESGIKTPAESVITPERLDLLVRSFLLKERVSFDFAAVTSRVLSIPRTREVLAEISYFQGFGKPTLMCKLDVGAKVVEWRIANARG